VPITPVLQESQQPLRLNLENQRKQARALLNSARAGDARALLRLAALHPKHKATTAKWSLHHAQLAVARELGFKSWEKLKAHIAADNGTLRIALVGAANRALEIDVDRPLFVDPLARALAGKTGLALHKELSSTTWPPYAAGPAPEQSILTRYFDDALQNAVEQFSLTQIVLLGAGMDTRAFRLRWPSNLVFFELDDAAVFDHKELVLRRRRAKPTCERRVVRANFAGAAWRAKLLAAGFDGCRRAAFLIPTHLVSFDAATVEGVFRALSELACEDSWLGVDLFSVDTIESPFMLPFQEKLGALGYPAWRFGVRHPETFLAEHGWRAECTVLGAPDASYGRWRYGYTPRTVPDRGIPRNYLAVARYMADTDKAR
jgi:methyltransferase (TIGR00027 family)